MSDKYIVVEDTAFAVDTDEQIATAESALLAAGVQEAAVYYGDPESPDSYKSTTEKLFSPVAE